MFAVFSGRQDVVDNINNISKLNLNIGGLGSCNQATPKVGDQQQGMPKDRVTISDEAKEARNNIPDTLKSEEDLEPEDKQQVNELKKRDAEVKTHEQAHMAAGGAIVQGGASYQYQRGPDGKMYAVGGEVKIDVSPERTPEGTIRKMQQVKRAALAPAQPSGTDRAVAARAAQVEVKARSELRKSQEEQRSKDGQEPQSNLSNDASASNRNSIDQSDFMTADSQPEQTRRTIDISA